MNRRPYGWTGRKMPKVFVSMSMSLDGYVAAPHRSIKDPLGEGGLRLHDWLFAQKTATDEEISKRLFARTGAVIVGWRTYIDAIHGAWENENPYGAPVFVVCKENPAPSDQIEGFTFVTGGIQEALELARNAAAGKDVWVQGGANIVQQYLTVGFIDELDIHLAPVILNGGLRLFENLGDEKIELEPISSQQTAGATHLAFRVVKPWATD